MNTPIVNPHRILITRTDRIGDLVLSTPVFSELRRKFPKAWIACLTFVENREIVQGNPSLDEVLLYDKQGSEKGWGGNLRFARKLAQKKFDVVIHLHATNRMHLVTRLAAIPVRIGWRRKCAWALTHAFPDLKKEGRKHEAEYNFDLLKPLGVEAPQEMAMHFPLSSRSGISLDHWIRCRGISEERPWVVLNPSASCPSKRWPAGYFAKLVEKLNQKIPAEFLAIGARKDRSLIAELREFSPVPIRDLSGRLSLGMLGHLLKRSALLISNDSGPVHIAAAVGTPVVSIFGRKQPGLSPQRWRPLGDRARYVWKDVGCEVCLAHLCRIHFLCLDAVSVEEVLRKIEELDIFNRSEAAFR